MKLNLLEPLKKMPVEPIPYKQWLLSLKTGDLVVLTSGNFRELHRVTKVRGEYITASRNDGPKFWNQSGQLKGISNPLAGGLRLDQVTEYDVYQELRKQIKDRLDSDVISLDLLKSIFTQMTEKEFKLRLHDES